MAKKKETKSTNTIIKSENKENEFATRDTQSFEVQNVHLKQPYRKALPPRHESFEVQNMHLKQHDIENFIIDIDGSESLDDTKLHKYLVRLYLEKGNEDSWCGSGVIVGAYLITVAHVMMDKDTKSFFDQLLYTYENEQYCVTECDIVYDGRLDLYDDVNNIHHDLLVFKLPPCFSSPFVLNNSDFGIPLDVCAKTDGNRYGYSFDIYKIIKGEGVHHNEIQPGKYEQIMWDNCFLTTGKFIPGNSGTPVYRHEIVYGLLIGKTWLPDNPCQEFYNFIDARYIRMIIAEIEETNR